MSAIWKSANWTRQFGIRQTGNRQFGMLPLERITLFLFFGVLSAWTKFMIKQYYKSIGVKKT